jgi:O-antigen/teichoic acid export membrane protein
LFKKIFSDKFSRSVLTLLIGTIVAQAIPLAVSPVLARLFTPEAFGLFALYFGISQIISVFITGRYEMAIILPEKDEEAINIVAISMIITLFISLFSLIVILPLRHVFSLLLNSPQLEDYLLLVPVTVFAIGIYTIFNLWLNRKGYYKDISAGKITRSAFSSIFSLGFGMTLLKSGGLIIADTIGQLISGLFVMIKSAKYDRKLIKKISLVEMKKQALRYVHFPKFNIVSGFFEKASGQLPVILLSSFFGPAVSGLFSLSQRIIAAPGSLIGASVGDVFRQQASIEFQKNGNCSGTFVSLLKFLVLIAVIPFAILIVFAPFLFSFVFGPEWRIAGEYAQIMTVMFFLSFVVSPLSNMFIIAEKQKIDLIIQILLFSFVSVSFVVGYNLFRHPKAAILLYSVTYCVKYCIELFLSFQFSKGRAVTINSNNSVIS